MAGSLITSRAANALNTTVEIRPAVDSVMRWESLGTWDRTIKRLRKLNGGGLWVGGTLLIFDDRVQFEPNAANRLIQTGTMSFDLAWSEVSEIDWRPGVLTSIIELRHGDRTEAVRCFGSKELADQMKSLRSANASMAPGSHPASGAAAGDPS